MHRAGPPVRRGASPRRAADADVVIANLGAWYNNVPSKDAKDGSGAMSGEALAARYEDDLGHLLRRLHAHERRVGGGQAAAARVADGVDRAALFRRAAAPGCGDARKYKRCHRQCALLGDEQALDWRNAALHRIAARATTCRRRWCRSRRSSAAWSPPQHEGVRSDCTHYCYSPVLWSALLDGVYRRIVNGARGRGAGLPSYLV